MSLVSTLPLRNNLFTNRNWKNRVLQIANHLAFIFALTLSVEWQWWAGAVVIYFFMFCIGVDIGVHRYFSHKSFQTTPKFKWFFAFCMTLSTIGSPLAWLGMHRMHHQFSDTEKDPHTPIRENQSRFMSFVYAYFGLWNRYTAE